MGELHLTSASIFHDMICPLKFANKDIVCGGGDDGGSEQHVCKVILVILVISLKCPSSGGIVNGF